MLINKKYDAIISTSKPEVAHLIASDLKKKSQIPWIADFRDLWTQNHYQQYSKLRHFQQKKLEISTVSSANALTTVSYPLAQELNLLHRNSIIQNIPNGFDSSNDNDKILLSKKFSIIYTGALYNCRRNPENFFEAVRELLDEGSINNIDLKIDFYGPDLKCLINLINKHKLNEIVQCHPEISRNLALKRQKEAQILLLIKWNNPQEMGVYTGKLFDYLAAGRPILSIGCSGGVIADLMTDTHAGVDLMTKQEIKEQMKKWYDEFKSFGYVKYEGDLLKIEKYSQREMAKKFSLLLNQLCN